MSNGIAIVKNVQQIQDVLWIVRKRESGKRYMGIGTSIEMAAMTETVKGKPRLCGHLKMMLKEGTVERKRLM